MTVVTDNDGLIHSFVEVFEKRDASLLAPYFVEDIVFQNYGDPEVCGRENLVAMWAGVFRSFARVKFETVNQAVNGDIVIAEQIHGLALPGRELAPVRNMAVYEIRDGQIAAWRDYTNPSYAGQLLKG
ncbi:MAG: nuclear transport factor 2 family protein [Hyphomicrobiales bacterium]|nr:MAG: nuclear transport factor 2 family protein [Hyphomicrobiales bacterium]